MPTRLSIDIDKLFPVQTFFNAIPDFRFIQTVAKLLQGIGAFINDTSCLFPGDLEPDEPVFEGIRFRLFEDVVSVSHEEFNHWLREACRSYVMDNPEDSKDLEQVLRLSRLALSS
jgi:hypothetical protein